MATAVEGSAVAGATKADPAWDAFAITPSDTAGNEFSYITRGIWVGGAGNISLKTAAGTTVLFSGIAAGTLLPVRAKQVFSTSTTATLMVGLY